MKILLLIYIFMTSLYFIYILIQKNERFSLLDLLFFLFISPVAAPILIPILFLEKIKIK
jgi:hypothetical protein